MKWERVGTLLKAPSKHTSAFPLCPRPIATSAVSLWPSPGRLTMTKRFRRHAWIFIFDSKQSVVFFRHAYERMFIPAGKLCPLTTLNSTLTQSHLITPSSWSLLLSKYIPRPKKKTCSGDVMTHRLRPAADGLAEISPLQRSLWSAKVNTDVRQHGHVSLMEAPPLQKKKKKATKKRLPTEQNYCGFESPLLHLTFMLLQIRSELFQKLLFLNSFLSVSFLPSSCLMLHNCKVSEKSLTGIFVAI